MNVNPAFVVVETPSEPFPDQSAEVAHPGCVTVKLELVSLGDKWGFDLARSWDGTFAVKEVTSTPAVGVLGVGDEVVAINGKQLTGLSDGEAIGLIGTDSISVSFVIRPSSSSADGTVVSEEDEDAMDTAPLYYSAGTGAAAKVPSERLRHASDTSMRSFDLTIEPAHLNSPGKRTTLFPPRTVDV